MDAPPQSASNSGPKPLKKRQAADLSNDLGTMIANALSEVKRKRQQAREAQQIEDDAMDIDEAEDTSPEDQEDNDESEDDRPRAVSFHYLSTGYY